MQVTSLVLPHDYLEDEYDTRDCVALKVSVKVFNNSSMFINKSAWEKYSYELYIEIGLTAEEVFFV